MEVSKVQAKAGRWSARLDIFIHSIGLIFLCLGVYALFIIPMGGTVVTRYTHLHECPSAAMAMTPDCYAMVNVTVTSVKVLRGPQGVIDPTITFYWANAVPSTVTVEIATPTAEYYRLWRGQVVQAKVWNGVPTALQLAKFRRLTVASGRSLL